MSISKANTSKAIMAALVAITVLAGSGNAEEINWQLEEQQDGISIYSRAVANSQYKAIKATVLIDAPIMQVSQFLGGGDECAAWRSTCKSSKVLEKVSEHEQYVYTVVDLPWPASDRDMVLHTTTTIDLAARTATVNLQSASSRHPEGDYVRAETRGQFVLRAVSEQQVEFSYIMHTELGGSLPAGRVNAGLADGAMKDLSRLRQLAEG